MATQNHRGQCTVELAIVGVLLITFITCVKQMIRPELNAFKRTQLSGGRR